MTTSYESLQVGFVVFAFCGSLVQCKSAEPLSSTYTSPRVPQPTRLSRPAFSIQPERQVVRTGGSALIAAAPENEDPNTKYQWLKDGKPLRYATNHFLLINNASLRDAGVYQLRMQTRGGTAMSDPAPLYILADIGTNGSSPGSPGGPGGNKQPCPGVYACRAQFRDASGNIQWTAPAGYRSCTISLVTPPFGIVEIKDIVTLSGCCTNNTVTCPVVAGRKYWFTAYYTTCPSGSVTLNYIWNP